MLSLTNALSDRQSYSFAEIEYYFVDKADLELTINCIQDSLKLITALQLLW